MFDFVEQMVSSWTVLVITFVVFFPLALHWMISYRSAVEEAERLPPKKSFVYDCSSDTLRDSLNPHICNLEQRAKKA